MIAIVSLLAVFGMFYGTMRLVFQVYEVLTDGR